MTVKKMGEKKPATSTRAPMKSLRTQTAGGKTKRNVVSREAQGGRANDWQVRIRMYRKWLGDCFLLTFRHEVKSHVMIDCGALVGTPDGKQKVSQAVNSIAQQTGGKLAALVVTHEHWDHVSGFSDALDSFKNFSSIGKVWVAWTEDPAQTVVQESKKLRFDAVKTALRGWAASTDYEDQQRGAAVCGLMDFISAGGLAAFSESTDEAMSNALSLGTVKYLSPGNIVSDIPGIRVYVLGPPKDTKALHKMKGKVGTDMYGLALSQSQIATMEAFSSAAAGRISDSTLDNYVPFETYQQWDKVHWSKEFVELAESYESEPARKIDRDWLNTAAELALQLDSYTNNTSLVLAFELIDSKDVLLFVGDAQIGNWQSWANVQFDNTEVSASDLLARTVFYKVGHHGSHNATLEDGGLEAMASSTLVAAIPVDEQFARTSKHWDMPAGPLLKALQQKTKGRLLRGDADFPTNSPKPSLLGEDEWTAFTQSVDVQEDYIDFYLK